MTDVEAVQATYESAQDSRRREALFSARIRELEDELERYRQATEDALQQLDWCIGYIHGSGRPGIAQVLSHNRSFIRAELLRRAEMPVPSQQNEGDDS